MSPGAGSCVGHYEIVALLGEGGVYTSHRLETSANRGRNERFLQEARAASALDHPNIGTVHGIDAMIA
jgi:hypothetical protein